VETKALRTNIMVVIAKFIYEFIIIRFGCLFTLESDHGTHFINKTTKLKKIYGGYSFLVSKGQKKHIGKFKNMMVWLV
jgi:hypothetical protein